jgi:hypothetical protein
MNMILISPFNLYSTETENNIFLQTMLYVMALANLVVMDFLLVSNLFEINIQYQHYLVGFSQVWILAIRQTVVLRLFPRLCWKTRYNGDQIGSLREVHGADEHAERSDAGIL